MLVFERVVEIQLKPAHEEPLEAEVNGPDGSCKRIGDSIYLCGILDEPDIADDDYIVSNIIEVGSSIDVQPLHEVLGNVLFREEVVDGDEGGVVEDDSPEREAATVPVNIGDLRVPARICGSGHSGALELDAVYYVVDVVAVFDVVGDVVLGLYARLLVEVGFVCDLHVEDLEVFLVDAEEEWDKGILGVVITREFCCLRVPPEDKGVVYCCIPDVVRERFEEGGVVELHLAVDGVVGAELGDEGAVVLIPDGGMNMLLEIGVPAAVGVGVEEVLLEEVVLDIRDEFGEIHGDPEGVGGHCEEAANRYAREINCR